MLNSFLTNRIVELALKYESADFLKNDPSQFMHRFGRIRDIETVAFISANLAFGRREQICSHISRILDKTGSSPSDWILSRRYERFFPKNNASFYRMYTNNDMRLFFDVLHTIFSENDSLGAYFKDEWQKNCAALQPEKHLHLVIEKSFPAECALIPHSPLSAAKKLNMFLRWMVRDNSPVDMGLWKWFDKKNLLIPLDTHVMQVATEFGLIEPARAHSASSDAPSADGKAGSAKAKPRSASLATAVGLTRKCVAFFPDDPVRTDFALFGFGVDSEKEM